MPDACGGQKKASEPLELHGCELGTNLRSSARETISPAPMGTSKGAWSEQTRLNGPSLDLDGSIPSNWKGLEILRMEHKLDG